MTDTKDPGYRYFSSVEGHVVGRFGSTSFIGVRRGPDGWVWVTDDVYRIPIIEINRYVREYKRALADGSLKEVTKADFDRLYPEKPVTKGGKKGGKSKAAAEEG